MKTKKLKKEEADAATIAADKNATERVRQQLKTTEFQVKNDSL